MKAVLGKSVTTRARICERGIYRFCANSERERELWMTRVVKQKGRSDRSMNLCELEIKELLP